MHRTSIDTRLDRSFRFARRVPGRWMVVFAAGALVPVLSSFNERRLLLTATLAVVVLSALIRRRLVLPPGRLAWTGAAVVLAGLWSSAASAAPAWGVLGVAFATLCVVAIVALANDLGDAGPIDYARFVGLGFVLPVGLCCVAMAATVYAALVSGVALRYPEPIADFANIRFFNQYQTWTLPFLAAALTLACPVPRVRETIWKALVIAVAVFFFALYWRSLGRGTGYATLLASLLVALALGPAGRAHALRMAMLAIAGYTVNLVMFGMGSNARVLSAASPGRWYLWDVALGQSMQHPWLGIGPMLFAGSDNGVASHPHNAVIQWAVEWGMPAALLMTATVGWLLVVSLYRARQRLARPGNVPAPVLVAVVASLLAGAAHALVSGVIVMPASQFMLVVVAALAAALAAREANAAGAGQSSLGRTYSLRSAAAFFYGAIALCVVYVGVFTAYDYTTRVRQARPQTDLYTRNALQPRYWADGTLTSFVTPALSRLENTSDTTLP